MTANALCIVVVALTLAAGLYSLVDAKTCPESKKLLRLFGFVLFVYLASVYTAVLMHPDNSLLRSGVLSIYGIIVVSFLFILEIWIDRRGQHA